MDHIGNNIRRIRESKNICIRELSDHLGISEKQYRRIEKGEVRPDLERICSIADYFRVSIDTLARRTNPGHNTIDITQMYERLVESQERQIRALEAQIRFLSHPNAHPTEEKKE
jgi:transcriptional regulator with XRE-family HTH domain